jgi:DNA-directed RNA polymerase subunit H (RpoH/RPB5)
MDSELIDLVTRTRSTILEILSDRGYNVDAHKNTSPADLFKMATGDATGSLLRIVADRKQDSLAPMEHCHVFYFVKDPIRQKIDRIVDEFWNNYKLNPTKDEIIVILSEQSHEVFHTTAAKLWAGSKGRISFFNIRHLTSNPAKHVYVPPHRKLSDEEAKEVMMKHNIRSKTEFPRIIYHVDMQARVLGLVPGDLVEIKRPSPTTGEYTLYRFCSV